MDGSGWCAASIRRIADSAAAGRVTVRRRLQDLLPAQSILPPLGNAAQAVVRTGQPTGDRHHGIGVMPKRNGAAQAAREKSLLASKACRASHRRIDDVSGSRDPVHVVDPAEGPLRSPGTGQASPRPACQSRGRLPRVVDAGEYRTHVRRQYGAAVQSTTARRVRVGRSCLAAASANSASLPRCQSANGSTRMSDPLPLSRSLFGPDVAGTRRLLSRAPRRSPCWSGCRCRRPSHRPRRTLRTPSEQGLS